MPDPRCLLCKKPAGTVCPEEHWQDEYNPCRFCGAFPATRTNHHPDCLIRVTFQDADEYKYALSCWRMGFCHGMRYDIKQRRPLPVENRFYWLGFNRAQDILRSKEQTRIQKRLLERQRNDSIMSELKAQLDQPGVRQVRLHHRSRFRTVEQVVRNRHGDVTGVILAGGTKMVSLGEINCIL